MVRADSTRSSVTMLSVAVVDVMGSFAGEGGKGKREV
jgi:hypothetical protein